MRCPRAMFTLPPRRDVTRQSQYTAQQQFRRSDAVCDHGRSPHRDQTPRMGAMNDAHRSISSILERRVESPPWLCGSDGAQNKTGN